MPRRGKRMGSDATALQEPSKTMSSDTARMMPKRTPVSESVKTVATVSPTESEIAAVAYQLWLNNGCPAGSDQEDWFRAEAALKKARRDTRTELEVVVEFRCWGHWEVWEMECGDPRWVWD